MHSDSRVVPWTEAQRVEGRLMVYPPRAKIARPWPTNSGSLYVVRRSEGRVRVGTGDDCTEQSSKASWWDAQNPASLVVQCVQCVPLAECRIEALAASRTSYETTPHVSFATRNMRLRQSIRSFSDGAPERVPRRSSKIPIPWQAFNSSALDVVNASFAAHDVPTPQRGSRGFRTTAAYPH